MRTALVFSLLLLGAGVARSQSPQEHKDRARAYLSYERYAEAASELRANRRLLRDDREAQLWMAVAAYEMNDLPTAADYLEGLMRQDEPAFPEVLLYLGRLHHARHQFSEAAAYYKRYLRRLRDGDERRQMVIEDIRRCDLGKEFQYRPARIVAENLGPAVNTAGDEYGPVPSPSQSGLVYFTARREGNAGGRRDRPGNPDPQWGNFTSDLYRTRRQSNEWTAAEPLSYLLNSPGEEELLGFAPDGRQLYYARGRFGTRQYFVDPFQEADQRQLNTLPLNIPLRPEQGDRTPHIVNDTLVYFASTRPGGFGGLDLYRMARRDGKWTEPENLGATLNSTYDETTPFLAPDGRTLYFSTNDSRRGIGGFDILTSYYVVETGRWTRPENPGLPLNSAGDDTHFRLLPDGYTGLLSSSRKDGRGGMDLYTVYFQDFQEAAEAAPRPEPVAVNLPAAPAPRPELTGPPSRTVVPVPRPSPPTIAARQTPPSTATLLPDYLFRYDRQLPSDEGSRYRLNEVWQQLADHPELSLVVTATTASVASGVFFAGLNRGRIMGRYFTERGIAAERIFLRSIPRPGTEETVSLHFAGPAVLDRPKEWPTISGASPYDQPLLYKVQVVAAQRPYQARDLEDFPHPMIESFPDLAFNRYTLGAFTEAAAAKAYRDELTAAGFRGAYVVAYTYGKSLEPTAVERWQATFPDLATYLAGG